MTEETRPLLDPTHICSDETRVRTRRFFAGVDAAVARFLADELADIDELIMRQYLSKSPPIDRSPRRSAPVGIHHKRGRRHR